MIQIAISGRGELQRAEADVIKRLVVNAERLIRILHQLVYGERCIVRLHDGIGYLNDKSEQRQTAAAGDGMQERKQIHIFILIGRVKS